MSAEAGWLEALGEGSQGKTAPGGLTGLLFWTGGLVAVGLGVGLGVGDRISPEVGWIATKLARAGVTAGPVLACGTLAIGCAWITRLQRRGMAMTSRALDQGRVLAKLAQDFSGLRENIARVQLEFAEVQQTNRTLLNLSREQAAAASENEPTKDAMFRLAASMDQLGARLEGRVRTLFDSLEERVSGLDKRLEETSMIQRSELAKLEERLTIAATLAQSDKTEIPYVDGTPKAEAETSPSAHADDVSDGEHATEEPVVELQPREEWLEIEVELEDDGELDEAMDELPGLFDTTQTEEQCADEVDVHWFEQATRDSGLVEEDQDTHGAEEDLLDAGEPTRISPSATGPVDTGEMLEQLDSLFGPQDSVADVLENLRRERGE